MVDRLPARRPDAGDREGRAPADRREGEAPARGRRRGAARLVGGPGRPPGRGRAPRPREERLDLPLLLRPRRGRHRDDQGHPRPAPRGTPRGPGDPLRGAEGPLPEGAGPLRLALRLRREGPPLLLDRRAGPERRRAGPLAPERQGAPHPRRRPRARGQPVREAGGGDADDLELRPPQPAGPRAAPRDRRALRRRARPARRRRAQPRPAGPELRLAGHHLRDELRRLADHRHHREGGDGAAGRVLGPVDRGLRDRLLHGRPLPALEERPAGVLPGRGGAAPPRPRRRAR